ncbi:MAG: AMP-binding protein [Planctomycetota bacterium]
MIDTLVCFIVRVLLWLRYRIRISGLKEIAAKGREGILFLPNHPALIDPVIVYVYLRGFFKPHGFADRDQVDRFFIRFFARRWGVRSVPSITKYGPTARKEVEEVLDESIEGLKRGENLLLWPAGRIYRGYKENLSANSSVERILQQCPDVRVVLVRTHGLWGSGFGWASGDEPKVLNVLRKGIFSLLVSGIFFVPRRKVTIEIFEPEDLPKEADRDKFNRYLEDFYNEGALPNTHVPYTFWEKGGSIQMPEPVFGGTGAVTESVPEATRNIVLDYLEELTGISGLQDKDKLAADIGMDSLDRTDLMVWLEKEFGFAQADADVLQTVGDVMLAACGSLVYMGPANLKAISPRWFRNTSTARLMIPEGESVAEVFLKQAARGPSGVAIADQVSGVKSYRDIVIACFALKEKLVSLEGDYLGIMLPASVATDIFYLAVLFSGKTPVMVNWTAGPRNMVGSLELVGVKRILTSKALVDKLQSQGNDLSGVSERFVFVEEIGQKVSRFDKLKAWLGGHFSWRSLYNAKVSSTAAVIFTSGSETLPKAVPLSHENLIANMRDVVSVIGIREDDRLIGFLPPFHSFGLTVTMLLPLCGRAQIVYHPNPVESGMMSQIIEAYGVSLLIGTPTFMNGIVNAGTKEQLSSVRLAVTGAEKCTEKVYAAVKKKCEDAVILEGYGVTECSPIISINEEEKPRPFTIGKVLPSLEYLLIDPETNEPVKGDDKGLLLVRGPSVFGGYLKYEGKSPFVEVEGKRWYSTGDLVSVDEEGVLTFRGRLKRFVKLGGEMVSLPAIEAVLERHYVTGSDEGPVLAVEATADEAHPELVLFTIRDIEREEVNRKIREAGLSGLHSIRKVVKLETIPLLGTGKTDYRSLKGKLREI